jgi:hypothetical protein
MLEIRFSELNWYKGESKSAFVRALFLHGLSDLYISFQMNKDLWTGCSIVPPKTSDSTNSYLKTLTSWVSVTLSSWEANLHYCDPGSAIPKLVYSVLKRFCHSNSLFSNISNIKKHGIKMENVYKLWCQADYFETLVWKKLIHFLQNMFS